MFLLDAIAFFKYIKSLISMMEIMKNMKKEPMESEFTQYNNTSASMNVLKIYNPVNSG